MLNKGEFLNLGTEKNKTPELKDKKEPKNIIKEQKERWANIMLGKENQENYELVNPNEFLPKEFEQVMGSNFEIKPGECWQTQNVVRNRILNYPRYFAMLPKNIGAEEKKKFINIFKGGIAHEAGHHIGEVQVFDAFLHEIDTHHPILTHLPIDKESLEKITQKIKKGTQHPLTQKALKRMAKGISFGPYLTNLPFVKDLHNIVTDIWLESYEKKYPNKTFAEDAKKGLDSLNQEIFPPTKKPIMENSGLLLSSQLKEALVLKNASLPDDKDWGEGGFDVWLKPGFADKEVVEELKNIQNNFKELQSVEGLRDLYTPQERIKWIRDHKIKKAYLGIRAAFLRLLEKDIEKTTQQKKSEDESNQSGSNHSQTSGTPSSESPKQEEKGGEKDDQEGDSGGEDNENDSKQPQKTTEFKDLPAEEQADILNKILDRIENERITPKPLDPKDQEVEDIASQGTKNILDKEQNKGSNKDENEDEHGGKGKESQTTTSDDFNKQDNKARLAKIKDIMKREQRHRASQIKKAELLGISMEELQDYEQATKTAESEISYVSDKIYEALMEKLKPFTSTKEAHGKLPADKVPAYFREIKDGNIEPNLFEERKKEKTIATTKLLYLLDHSSSMNDKAESMALAELIITEGLNRAYQRAKKEINKIERSGNKKLFDLSVITFAQEAQLRKQFDDNEIDDKLIAQLYFTAKNIGGGSTADAEALNNTIEYLKQEEQNGQHQRLKPIVPVIVISDGQGEVNKLKKIFQETAALKRTSFLAIGAGSDTQDIVSNWGDLKGAPIETLHIPDDKINRMHIKIVDKFIPLIIKMIKNT